jgi:formate dehydrogenase alpha subunit
VVSIAEQKRDADYPFTAIIGSLRYHLGGGTRTAASERMQQFVIPGEVDICTEDAVRLDLKEGDTVQIQSRWGTIKRKIKPGNSVGRGQLFISAAIHSNDCMNLIDFSDLTDPKSDGWKTCAVTLKKA